MILYTIFFFKETELNFFTQKSSNLLANFCANAPIFICFCSRLRLIQIALHVMLWRCAAKNAKANNGEHPKTRRRCYENRPLPKFESKNRLPHKKTTNKKCDTIAKCNVVAVRRRIYALSTKCKSEKQR